MLKLFVNRDVIVCLNLCLQYKLLELLFYSDTFTQGREKVCGSELGSSLRASLHTYYSLTGYYVESSDRPLTFCEVRQ